MTDRLRIVQLKAKRADDQIRDLEATIRAFLDSPAYVVSTQKQSETGNTIHYLSKVSDVDPIIPHLAGEAIHSLRSTLDHLAYQLFLVNRTDPNDEGASISFPIYDPAKTTEASAFGKIKVLGNEAIELIRAFKPYQGGNNLLWAIHKLDNIDKHRTLLTVGAGFMGLRVDKGIVKLVTDALGVLPMPPIGPIALRLPRLRCPLNVGDKLFLGFAEDEERNKELEFSFTVAINEPRIGEAKPVLDVLRDMARCVDSIINAFASLLK